MNSFVINWSSAADRSEENCCQLDSQRALLFLQPLRGLINAPTPPACRPAAATRAWPGTLPHTLRPSSCIKYSLYTHLRGCQEHSAYFFFTHTASKRKKSIELCHFESGNYSGAIKNPRMFSGQVVKVDKIDFNMVLNIFSALASA